jgi:hypothetical protein
MADQEKDKQMQIDEMLDSLLAKYSSAEPRLGLETRILANLTLANPRDGEGREASHGWWNFKWLWVGAVLAAVIVAGVLIGGKRHVAPPDKTVVQTAPPAVEEPEIQRSSPATAIAVPRRRKTFIEPRPQNTTLALSQRPAVFPTPTPLSEQERLLLSYYSRTPREEVIAQSHPDEPPVVGDQDQTEAIPDLMHIPQKVSNTR